MKENRISRRRKWLAAGGILLLILAVLAGVFFWYVSDYYRAEDVALQVLARDDSIEVQEDLTILSPRLSHRHRHHFLSRRKGGGRGLSAAAGSDPADGSDLYSGPYALSYGDL